MIYKLREKFRPLLLQLVYLSISMVYGVYLHKLNLSLENKGILKLSYAQLLQFDHYQLLRYFVITFILVVLGAYLLYQELHDIKNVFLCNIDFNIYCFIKALVLVIAFVILFTTIYGAVSKAIIIAILACVAERALTYQ